MKKIAAVAWRRRLVGYKATRPSGTSVLREKWQKYCRNIVRLVLDSPSRVAGKKVKQNHVPESLQPGTSPKKWWNDATKALD
jgi:hypothetical protein